MSRIGFALCGSFCTHAAALIALEALLACGHDIQPILSETAFATDTRFGCAAALRERLESLCGRAVIHTVPDRSRWVLRVLWMLWSSVPAPGTRSPSWRTA